VIGDVPTLDPPPHAASPATINIDAAAFRATRRIVR